MDIVTLATLVAKSYTLDSYDIGSKESSARAWKQEVNGERCLLIPGTDNIACWLADLNIEVVQTPVGSIHKGFSEAANSISAGVLSYEPDVLAGHSEGGDLALILGGICCYVGKPPRAIYAYDPARCCIDDRLSKLFKLYSVDVNILQHGNDIVPQVPRLLHDWRHPEKVQLFGEPAHPIINVEDHYLNDRYLLDLNKYQQSLGRLQ